jgi:hypothetical protein
MKKIALMSLVFACAAFFFPGQAQLIKKIKAKANEVKEITKPKTDTEKTADSGSGTNDESGNGTSGNSTSGKPQNKGGGGLKNTTPPDVNAQMTEAETAFKAKNYNDARYSIQQALVGVELQLGRELLNSLPAQVNNLPKDTTQDKVVSTQWGWSNMTIQRVYWDKKDKQTTITIGNNSVYGQFMNLYFNGGYVEANNKDQNIKQVKVKGNKGVIQYDDNKGYTLMISLGQSSMIVWECINFADETEVMKMAESFDIDAISKKLGEQ